MNDLEVAAYIDRGLSTHRLNEIEEHLASCATCRNSLADAQELVAQSRRPARYLRTAAAIAAAAVVVLVAASSLRVQGGKSFSEFRASDDRQPLAVYGPLGEIRTGRIRFTWGALSGSLSYHLTVTSDNGEQVWSASSSDTTLVLPASVVLDAGARYSWTVDAIASDGSTHSTGTHEFGIVR